MGYRHHAVNTGGIPVDYIQLFTSQHDIPVFIETGTAGGESVRAVAPMFRICHTIEIVTGRSSGNYPENVRLHEGDSGELIGQLASSHKKSNIFFWLDAHWSEPYESPIEVNECPLLQEIDAIYHAGCSNPFIMIDDARLFLGPPPWPCNPEKWPRLKDVFIRLVTCFPEHIITVVDDYVVCIPQYARDVFRDEWRGRFNDRYPTEQKKIQLAAKNVYGEFIKYIS